MQLGIIGDIDQVEDEIVRFYAFKGYCVSTAAGIEHLLFSCFYSANDLSEEDAAAKFYGSKRFTTFSQKRDLADEAVKDVYRNPGVLETWDKLISEISAVTGVDGARNVLAHNILSIHAYENEGDPSKPYLFELAVSRNRNEAAAFGRDPRVVNLKSVREEACALNSAYMRLFHFYDRHLKHLYKKIKEQPSE